MRPRDALCRYPLFALLDGRGLDAWVAAGQEVAFPIGETIFQAGTPGLWAYIVMEGRIRVLRPGSGREISLGCYGPGEVFGEYALVPPGQNTATCRAAGPSRLLRLSLQTLRPLVACEPRARRRLKDWMRLHPLVSHLRDQAFLGFMSAPSALKWLDHLEAATFQPACTIQADGLSADCWFFIRDGRVALDELTDQGVDRVRELGRGDCFGERALAGRSGLPHAVALGETHCLSLSQADFEGRSVSADGSLRSVFAGASAQSFQLPSAGPFRWVGQEEESDCGLAALAMVACFYDRKITVETIRQRTCLQQRGASLSELARIAAELGFKAQAVRIAEDQYSRLDLPAVVHCRDEHYVVLCVYSPTHVYLGDPATGMVQMHRVLFHQQASGQLLLLRPLSEKSQ